MRLGSVRSICAILSLVHNQTVIPSLHSVSRCTKVSRLPRCLQRSDSTSLMTCRRPLVGTISCTTVYHMDAISSDRIRSRTVQPVVRCCTDWATGPTNVIPSLSNYVVVSFRNNILVSSVYLKCFRVLYCDSRRVNFTKTHNKWGINFLCTRFFIPCCEERTRCWRHRNAYCIVKGLLI